MRILLQSRPNPSLAKRPWSLSIHPRRKHVENKERGKAEDSSSSLLVPEGQSCGPKCRKNAGRNWYLLTYKRYKITTTKVLTENWENIHRKDVGDRYSQRQGNTANDQTKTWRMKTIHNSWAVAYGASNSFVVSWHLRTTYSKYRDILPETSMVKCLA